MARTIAALFVLCAAFLMSAALTVSSLTFTAQTISQIADLTVVKTKMKPTYMPSTMVAKAQDLNVATAVPVVPVTLKTEAPPAAAPAFVVDTASLRVRAGPAKASPQLFGLERGAQVTVSRTERGWMLVTAEGGRTGWVYGKYLRPVAATQLQAQLQ